MTTRRRSWVEQIMGLPVSVLARGPAALTSLAHRAVQDLYAQLRQVDRTFSTYQADSVVSRLARGEIALEDCDDEVRWVAARCVELTGLTNGLFDATTPEGTWDPSGLVKGWAAERAARHLRGVEGLDWCLNAGGDVTVLCPSGTPFVVGIQDPHDPQRVVATLALASGAVATSGTAARGAHLYDPRTGTTAAPAWASVTVTGPSLERADVLATAAYVAGPAWTTVLRPGYAGLAVDAYGALLATPDWPGTLTA